jgi:hypothetical protein
MLLIIKKNKENKSKNRGVSRSRSESELISYLGGGKKSSIPDRKWR